MSTTVAEEAGMGMRAMPHEPGIAFRVWAPDADAVSVAGWFNDWSADIHPMARERGGYWYADITSASVGDQYRYRIVIGAQQLSRIDPMPARSPARWAMRWLPILSSIGMATSSTCLPSTSW
jgi:1,4-alpha-glucan branching enzyme